VGFRRGPHDQGQIPPATLHVGEVHFCAGLRVQAGVLDVFDYSDDLDRTRPIVADGEPLADWFLPTHESSNEALIDQCDWNRVRPVMFDEIPALDECRAHRLEVVRADLPVAGSDSFAGADGRKPLYFHRARIPA